MNSNHVIDSWIAQLHLDAHRGAGPGRVAVEPAPLILETGPAAESISPPARTRGRRLPVGVWSRDGASRRGAGRPCLSVG